MSWMVIGDGCSQDTVGNCKEGVINFTCYKCIPYFSKVIFCYANNFCYNKGIVYIIIITIYICNSKICLAINIKMYCFTL